MIKYKKSLKFFVRLLEIIGYIVTLAFIKNTYENKKNLKYKKILIIEPYGLGDCVYLEMTIRSMLLICPDTEFYILCNKDWFPLFNFSNKIITIDSSALPLGKNPNYNLISFFKLYRILSFLRRNKIDLGIDFRGDIRNQILLRFSNVREVIGYAQYIGTDLDLKGYLLSYRVVYVAKQRLEQHADIVRSIPQFKNFEYSTITYKRNIKYQYDLVINLGAGWKYRLWKSDKWNGLIERLIDNFRIIIISSPNEIELFDELNEKVKNNVVHRITHSINDVNEVLQISKIFLGIDSGVLHLAARIGMPIIGLYGPGNIDIWKPPTKNSIVIHKQQYFPCSPCRQVNCIFPDSNCMDAINVEDVYIEVKRLICTIKN